MGLHFQHFVGFTRPAANRGDTYFSKWNKVLWIRIVLLLLIFSCNHVVIAQTDSLLTHCLRRIAAEQSSGDRYFAKGLIRSYRQYDWNPRSIRPDDNIFYNGITLYTLNRIAAQLPTEAQPLLAQLNAGNRAIAPQFANRKGRNTYNFWSTADPEVFPNSGWINLLDKVNALPDDMDDTAMMLLALNADSATVAAVHRLMQDYTNQPKKRIRNTIKGYENIGAYSTWFGVKMPIDFDACVMSNVLLMVQRYHLAWTAADSASLDYLTSVIDNGHHLSQPHIIAPHYATAPIVLYHLSRLMAELPIAALEARKARLVKDAQTLYPQQKNWLDKVMLRTALLRWGVALPAEALSLPASLDEVVRQSDFVFFIANMASMAANPWRRWVGSTGVGKFYYYCPAYNYALLAEYLVMEKMANR